MSESRDPKNLFKSPIEVTNDGLLFKASKIEYFCNISSALTNTESKFKNFVTTYDQTPLPDLAPKESMTAFCSFFEFEEGEVKTVNLDFVVKYYFFGKRKKIFRYTVEKNPKDVIFWMSRSASEK